MKYTIYETTNKVNGKTYIGKHQTEDLNDDYLGSGKYLRRAIEKYSVESFEKKILYVFDNEQEMNDKEAELVTEEFCKRTDTYNICPGGNGGFGYINQNRLYAYDGRQEKDRENYRKAGEVFREMCSSNTEYKEQWSMKVSEGLKIHFKENDPNFKDQKHSDETKKVIGEKSKLHQSGEGNSQFGKMWITDGTTNQKISKDDKIPDGWRKGRVLKKKA